jgi:hypothetical protein
LTVQISDRALLEYSKEEIESSLKNKIQSANRCINEAFSISELGRGVSLSISITNFQYLESAEVQVLGIHPFELDETKSALILGRETNHHVLSFHGANCNHVPPAKTREYNQLMSHETVMAFAAAENVSKERLEYLNARSPNPFSNISNEDQFVIETFYEREDHAEAIAMEKHAKTPDVAEKFNSLKLSNIVRLEWNELRPEIDPNIENVIAHELMHSFGGLPDRYTDPANTEPNLMGAHGGGNTCILDDAQVRKFLKYRGLI